MRLYLIDLQYAAPAVDAHFAQWLDDDGPLSEEEHRVIAHLLPRHVMTVAKLREYAEALAGEPNEN